jgi:hypothetical protein
MKLYFDTPVDELNLSVKTSNCLRNVGIKTVGELVQYSSDDLAKAREFGKKSFLEIESLLAENDLKLGMNILSYSNNYSGDPKLLVKDLNIRDYFAGQALAGISAIDITHKAMAIKAYGIADAMLAERDGKNE